MSAHPDGQYDPYIPNSGEPGTDGHSPWSAGRSAPASAQPFNSSSSPDGPKSGTDGHIDRLQKELAGTVKGMQDNLKAAAQRGNNLNDLEDKTYALNQSSSAFSSRAKAVRKRMWWKDMKMKVWIGVGITVIILIIIIAAVEGSKHK